MHSRMRFPPYRFRFIAALISGGLFSACTSSTPGGNEAYNERATLEAIGVPSLALTSPGQLFNLNYVSLPKKGMLQLIGNTLYFDNDALDFLWCSDDIYVFHKKSLNSEIRIGIDKGESIIQVVETGGLFARVWKSTEGLSEFIRWKSRFSNLGFSENRLGFLPHVKFVDGSRAELPIDERRAFTVEIRESEVLWDGELVALSIATMENQSLAVQLKKDGATFWLYGGGNFQVNISGSITSVFVGSSRSPTGATMIGSVPEAYTNFYPRLKALALGN